MDKRKVVKMWTKEKVDRKESKKSPFFYKFLSKIKEPRTSNLLRTLRWKNSALTKYRSLPLFHLRGRGEGKVETQ